MIYSTGLLFQRAWRSLTDEHAFAPELTLDTFFGGHRFGVTWQDQRLIGRSYFGSVCSIRGLQ